jgi:hypothetical protein
MMRVGNIGGWGRAGYLCVCVWLVWLVFRVHHNLHEKVSPWHGNDALDVSLFASLWHTVKKGLPFSHPQPGCHKPNSPWPGIIYFSRPVRVWLVTSRLGTGKSLSFFTVLILKMALRAGMRWNGRENRQKEGRCT